MADFRISHTHLNLYPLGIFLLGFFCFLACGEKTVSEKEFSWQKYEDAVNKSGKEGKIVLIVFYEEWSDWSRHMFNDTFANSDIKQILATKFISVKVDINNQKRYSYKDMDLSAREFADLLNVGKKYPVIVFLDENMTYLNKLNGYHKPENFNKTLVYFGERIYKNKKWKEFLSDYENNPQVK